MRGELIFVQGLLLIEGGNCFLVREDLLNVKLRGESFFVEGAFFELRGDYFCRGGIFKLTGFLKLRGELVLVEGFFFLIG